MTYIRSWNPFREIADMQRQLDHVFDEVLRDTITHTDGNWMPIDVIETDENYTVFVDMPGMNPDEINVNFHDGELTICGEIVQASVEENNRILVQERGFGKFSRGINLPMPVDADNISASYDNGVLMLKLPKVESAKPRQIEVKQQKLLHSNGNN